MLLCLSACSSGGDDPIEPTPKPEVIKSEITIDSSIISNGLSFSNVGGEQSISFTTNENWTLSIASTTSGVTWCTASTTSGSKGTANVKFTVTENTDYDNRSVSVTIKSGTATKTFTISQKGVDALLVTTDKYEVSQEGGTIEIEVKANIDYKMEISEKAKEWIKESSSRALTTYRHKLEISMNETFDKREGEVTFKSGDKMETVKVYQAGGAIILLSQNEYSVNDAGETISVEIKSNVEFGVQMPDVDWITDEASSRGMSSHTLKYAVAPNKGYDNRSAEIIFYDKNSDLKETLKVVQSQKDAIVISEKNISVAQKGGTVEVKVNTNVDFEVQIPSDATWITKTGSRALTEKSFFLKITENTAEDDRSVTITITNKNSKISDTAIITQQGNIPTITLKEAGTMKSIIEKGYSDITSLRVIGPINGDDIATLRTLKSLKTLNLANANIVKGGSFEYKKNNGVLGASWHKETCSEDNKIPNNTFNNGFRVLEKLILPITSQSIGNYALEECISLKQIQLPPNVKTIGNGAFTNCFDLEQIDLPKTVISIGAGAFWQCNSLLSIEIPEGITKIASNTFAQCRNIKNIKLPESLTEIEPMAFSQCCWGLVRITIPKNVKKIGYQAFYKCDKLAYVTCLAETAPDIRHRLSDNSLIYSFDDRYYGYLSVPKFCSFSYQLSDWKKFFAIVEMDE